MRNTIRHVANWQEENKWKLEKFHDLIHLLKHITMFRNPSNYNIEGGKRNHKLLSKRPYRTVRKYALFFSDHVAKRVPENLILKRIQQQSKSSVIQTINHQKQLQGQIEGSQFQISYQMPNQPHAGKLSFHNYQEHDPRLFDYRLEQFVFDEQSKVVFYT